MRRGLFTIHFCLGIPVKTKNRWFMCPCWTTQNGVRGVFHLKYLFSYKHREYVSIPRSHSDQRFYLGHGNIPMQDDADLWPCKNVVSINLPFPGKGSILPQSSVLVLVTIQLCSRGARGAGHVPTAEQQILSHIVCSAGAPLDTVPEPGQRVGWCLVVWRSRKPLCMIPWLGICNKGPKSCGSISGCCVPGSHHLPERKADH